MTQGRIEVEGAAELDRTLRRLASDLNDLGPAHEKAGRLLLDRANPRTPRQDGSLAASGRLDVGPTEVSVSYTEVYAGVIHNGSDARNIEPQPWLTETAADTENALEDVYRDHVEDLVDRVRGA